MGATPGGLHALDDDRSWFRAHWRPARSWSSSSDCAVLRSISSTALRSIPHVELRQHLHAHVLGGSDSYYWTALCYSFQETRCNYRFGNQNPRRLCSRVLLVGRLIAPLFSTAWQGVLFTFLLSAGLFGSSRSSRPTRSAGGVRPESGNHRSPPAAVGASGTFSGANRRTRTMMRSRCFRRLDVLFLPARPADDEPQTLGRQLVPERLDRHRTPDVPEGEPD